MKKLPFQTALCSLVVPEKTESKIKHKRSKQGEMRVTIGMIIAPPVQIHTGGNTALN
jgi:hypothetical protein